MSDYSKISKEAFSVLLRFGRKNLGPWDDLLTDTDEWLPDDSDAYKIVDVLTRQQWIKTSEHLPEGSMESYIGWNTHDSCCDVVTAYDIKNSPKVYTHWMLWPKPPEVLKDE